MLERIFETRAVTAQALFASGSDFPVGGTTAAVVINSTTVFQVNAVFSAVSLIADTISTLPLDVFVRRDGARFPFRPKPTWVDKPDIDLPREAFYSGVITSLLLDGNAFIKCFYNSRGEVSSLAVLNPTNVKVVRSGIGRLVFTLVDSGEVVPSEDIVFIPDVVRPGSVRGVSRVEALKENFGLALALERFASTFFGQGTTLAGVIEFPGTLTQEQADNLSAGFDTRHKGWRKSNKTGVLTGGAKWVSTQVDPEKSTLVDSRNQSVLDICRAFNVPPHLLAITEGSSSYASVEQTNLAWVTHGLRPIIQKIEGAMTPLMARTPGGENAFLKFNLDGLLRGDIATRANFYGSGLQNGYLTINDVRRIEDLRPIDDAAADTVRVPLANINIDAADLSSTQVRVQMALQLVQAGYQPEQVLSSLGLPPVPHTGIPSAQLQQVPIQPVEVETIEPNYIETPDMDDEQ